MRTLSIKNLYQFTRFRIDHDRSLATNIQSCNKLPDAFELYSQYSSFFIPRTYSLFSRKIAQMLTHSHSLPTSTINQYLHDLIQIQHTLLSIQQSLGVLFFGRCLTGINGELSAQMIEFMFRVFKHCGFLLLNFNCKFSCMVDYIFELNSFIDGLNRENEGNRQFISEMKPLKQKIYQKIDERYPTTKNEKVDLIYHLVTLTSENIKEEVPLIMTHRKLTSKLMEDLKQLLPYLTINRLTKSINIILAELPKIEADDESGIIFKMVIEYLQRLNTFFFEKAMKKSQDEQIVFEEKKIKQNIVGLKARKNVQGLLLKMTISYNQITKVLKNLEKVQHHFL